MGSRNLGLKFALIVLLTGMGFYLWSPTGANLLGKVPKGLDLAGGAELIYRIRVEELPESMRGAVLAQAAQVVQKRLGVLSESKVVPNGSDRILVQMPNADQQTVEDLKEKIKKSGRLEFRMVLDERCDRPEVYRRAMRNKEKGLPPPPGTHWYGVLGDRGVKDEVLVDDHVEMTGDAIDPQKIGVTRDERFRDAVSVSFTPEGGEAMNRIAKKAYPTHQRMAIILNDVRSLPTEEEKKRDAGASGPILEQGACYSAPSINADHFNGGAQITGEFSPKELGDLIGVFQAGSLPAPLELERQMQVGPSLGEDQMRKGLKACLCGVALVVAFMMAYYLVPGMVASFALMLNLVLLMGIMGALGATLTLTGIAGVALTLGMAVDANVLQFERIREEMAAGKAMVQAIRDGYERAFVTIFDSHVTTIITSVVLYALGSEQVKGFAVTLGLGLVASLFTSVVVTHAIFDLAVDLGWMKSFRMLQVWPKSSIDFMRLAPWGIACSLVLNAGGMFNLFAVQGKSMLAVDFTGGRILQLRFAEGHRIEDVRAGVDKVLGSGGYTHGADAQVVSLKHAGGLETGLPRDFEITTRNLDVDSDHVRETAKTILASALRGAPVEVPDAPPGMLVFDLNFTAPQEPEQVRQTLAQAGLAGVEVKAVGELKEGRAREARLTVARHHLVEDLRTAFGTQLVASAFQVAVSGERHTEVVCAVRDMTQEQVLERLASPAVNLKGCTVVLGAPGDRGVAPLTIRSPLTDAEEVKKRLLRHFGPELCLQDVPFAKVYPDGSSDVEIRLAAGMTMEEFAKKRDETRKGLELQLGSVARVTEYENPADTTGPIKGVVVNYKSGMKDLMQYLFLLRQPGSGLNLVEPFKDARMVPAMARLTFSVLDDAKKLEPAQKAAQAAGGTVVEGALVSHPGGFHATLEVSQDAIQKAETELRKGYAQDLSDPIPRDDVVGGVVAGEAIGKTMWALVASWAALIIFIAFRFEFVPGVAAVVALIHDVMIVLGVLTVTHTQIDMTIVAALLTIVGYSVNDTIVIFDRIRENLGNRWNVTAVEFGRVVNLSVNQTLSRTLLTSFTVFISVVSLFAGGEVFKGFAIAMLAGVITGTYSSVYIAAPLVQFWKKRQEIAPTR